MLVLLRKFGDSLMFNSQVKATPLSVHNGIVEIEVTELCEGIRAGVFLGLRDKVKVMPDVDLYVSEIGPNYVKLAIEAPRSVAVHREEIYNKIMKERATA